MTVRAPDSRATTRTLLRELLGALVVYLMLSFIFTSSTWRDPANRWIGICCDQQQSIWFLAWFPTAFELGQNPLLTDRLNAPDGANLMWNAASPLIAAVLAPITIAAGPILAYNVAVVAAIVLSGLAAFAALRRYAAPAGSLVGGALFAFSPYVASQTALHLNLIHVWAPPLFLILLDELLVRRRHRPEVLGVALGILGALQLLTFEEVLATSAVTAAVLTVVLAVVVRERAAIAASARRVVRGLGPGLVAFLLIGGFPLGVQLLGPQQIHGRFQDASIFSMDLLNAVLPTPYQLLAPEGVTELSSKFSGLYHEATGYVGVPLLLVLTWLVATRWRDLRVLVSAVMAVAMLVFSLGPELRVGAEPVGVPMPWLPIGSLPLIEHALPGRLTLYMWLAIAVLVALAVDHVASMTVRRAGAGLAVIGVALAFIVPAPAASSTSDVPPFFRNWSDAAIGRDEIILFAPWFTNGAGADPMLWAAVADARPRMYEGYVYVPDADGQPRYGPEPGPLGNLMIETQDTGVLPTVGQAERDAALQQIRDVGISVVIVGPMRYREEMVALFTDLLGEPPTETGGVQLWRDVDLVTSGVAAEPS